MENRLMDPPPAAESSQELHHDPALVPQFQHCIEACLQCYESCEQLIVHVSGSEKVDAKLIRTLNDAIEITQVAATFMLRGSNFHIRTCAVCAEVCKVCAEVVEEVFGENKDELVRATLTSLNECSKSCYQMAHHH